MDPATLAATVRGAVFTSTQFRAGYDEGAVDDLLDELVHAVETGSSGAEVAAIATNTQLPITSMRRGYDRGDVDDFLQDVVRQASDLVAGSPPAAVPAAQERAGLGGRLLRLLRGD
jgi:DivIVA domain-containing protein